MIRKNVLKDQEAAEKFYEALWRLKDPQVSPWPGQDDLALYDFFVFWHHRAMMLLTPADQMVRNAAHSGPVFLPWHRYLLIRLEGFMREALDDDDFRLPYWDWAHDAATLPDPTQSDIWSDQHLGQFMDEKWEIRFDQNSFGNNPFPRTEPRRMRRFLGQWPGRPMAPTPELTGMIAAKSVYDSESFDDQPEDFRNVLEGWQGDFRFHNNVHLFVGGKSASGTVGDMVLSTSPNDPTFFLHHCNCDRAWATWQAQHAQSPYVPDENAPEALLFHRLKDRMYTFFDETVTPDDMLNYRTYYEYEELMSDPNAPVA